jgi:hypothetical protein
MSNENSSDNTINYEEIGRSIGALVAAKNKEYGNSFSGSNKVMEILLNEHYNEETGTYNIPKDLLINILAITRIIDKLFRLSRRPSDQFNEDPFEDIAGYGILGHANTISNKIKTKKSSETEDKSSQVKCSKNTNNTQDISLEFTASQESYNINNS